MAILPILEPWARKSLQGITFWIGHRHCLYEHYPLGESAFVAELCNLIFAHLDKSQYTLRCEVRYRELAANLPEKVFGNSGRADIVIFEKPTGKSADARPSDIIEVKRGRAGTALIHSDLRRLAEIRRHTHDCRTFLFVICESYRHPKFITPNGLSKKGDHPIDGDPMACYRVRRTYKAAHAFVNKETGQYACCIEVFNRPPTQAKSTAKLKLPKRSLKNAKGLRLRIAQPRKLSAN